METAEKALNVFPVHLILFIVTAGLFIVVSFPFNLFDSLPNGSGSVVFGNFYGIPFPDLSYYANAGFLPFASLKLLAGDNFLTGVGILVLCSLPVGVLMYLLYDSFERINHIHKWIFSKITGKKPKTKEDELIGQDIDPQDFIEYLDKLRITKNLVFSDTIREISIAFLYGSETLWVMFFAVFIFTFDQQAKLGWLIISSFLLAFFALVYLGYKRRYSKVLSGIMSSYKKTRNKPASIQK